MQTKEKFVAFIDILGFSSLVEKADSEGEDLTKILILPRFGGHPC